MKYVPFSLTIFLSLVFSLAFGEERIVEFPAPTGSHAIGKTSFRWADKTRPEEMTAEPDDHREVVVHLWYPALASGNEARAPYFPDLELLKKEVKWPISGAFRAARTNALSDAPVAVGGASYPVVLLLHGNEMNSVQYSFFVEELVSQGYIVAGIDSPGEARGVVLSGGRTLGYGGSPWAKFTKVIVDPNVPLEQQPYPKLYRARVDARVADARFVLNQLEQLNAEKGSRFVGRLDLTRVGIFGHSHGAVAAVNAGIADTRFKACLNLDGLAVGKPYFPAANGDGPAQPLMMLMRKLEEPSDKDLEKMGTTRQQWRERAATVVAENFGHLKSNAYRLVMSGAKHNSFSNDAMMEAALLKPKELATAQRQAQIVRTYILAFFDKHLKDKKTSLLDAASADYPEIEFRHWPPKN